MKSDFNPFVLLGLGAAGYFVYNQNKNKVTAHEYGNLRLAITGSHVEGGDIVITLNVQNPNPEGMSIKSLIGTLYANGQQVAAIKMFGDYTARDNGETTLQLMAKPLTSNLLTQLREAMTRKVNIALKGTININNHALPINLSFSK